MQITPNNYGVLEIIQMLERRELVVNNDYQRGSGLWPDGASSYFIDTILESYPFPKIYMAEYLDRPQRAIRKEIVDGQQRITTIQRFYNNDLRIVGDSRYAGLRYDDLDEDAKDKFLSYSVGVDVIRNASSSEILQMFRRMNAYTLPLNEAERRHSSFQGEFKWFINHLSDEFDEFFTGFGVFTRRQIVRMADAELIADGVLALEKGIVSTSASNLRDLYDRYDEAFPNVGEYREKLQASVRFIVNDLEPLRNTFLMKPYAVQSLITALVHCRFGIEQITENLGVQPIGAFATDPQQAREALLELARAHEAKETEGPHSDYVWGALGGTNRYPRRLARVIAILRALGAVVPAEADALITR
jgi:hypothetical protein